MKITEFVPTPEYLYQELLKDRKNALHLAVVYINQGNRYESVSWIQQAAKCKVKADALLKKYPSLSEITL